MSFTPLLRQSALARRTVPATRAFGVMRVGVQGVSSVRGVSGSAPKKAAAAHHGEHDGHGHHDSPHGDHHHVHEADPDVYKHESLLSPGWRPFWAVLAVTILAWPFIPAPAQGSFSPSLDPEGFAAGRKDPNLPWITRWILNSMPTPEQNREAREKYLRSDIELANSVNVTAEAEIPKVRKLRYPSTFEQASPNQIAVGSQADLSDLKVQ
ncbi:hypothetical protein IAT38_008369 [Cryptococcus sp. DSM 104549]